MPPQHVLALDEGTSSCRSMVFDADGGIVGVGQSEFTQHFPKPGWVEHDPEEIWDRQLATVRQAIDAAGIGTDDLAAIGITNQRETILVWDRTTGVPVHPAIVWQDRRTSDVTDRLKADGREADVTERTGLVLDPYFSATKLQWILDRVPGVRERANRGELAAGTIDTWLIWKLTGGRVHATDASNASRTLLWNLHDADWDERMLELFDVPREVLPEVVTSSGVIAETDPELLGRAIPIAGIAGDQQAALFGQLCTRDGMVKNTYGTGCFMLMHTGTEAKFSPSRMLTTVAWRIGDGPLEYALEGSVFIAGAAIQWLRDGLKIIDSAPQVNELAASVEVPGGVFVVPAFAGLGAPHWDPRARAAILGLTRGSTDAHVALATLRSLAYRSRDILDCMESDSGIRIEQLRVDGGACVSDLLMQFQADILGVPVARPKVVESTAIGAAYLAGLAVGLWEDLEDLESNREIERIFEPSMDASERERLMRWWRKAVDRTLDWAEED
ncbi:MAG: glycerol kinase GlpK [Planctomycetota bacterium]|nr:glycerol kinase GlpK [Planctomycetota bacterium]